jgi:hypothetical protein
MKKTLVAIALTVLSASNVYAEEQGAWVAVDSSGKVVSEVIVCTPSVCGDVNSPYAKGTLQEGQKYVLQTKADSNGNVAGIGNNTPNTAVKVDVVTNTFTVTSQQEISVTPSVVILRENIQTFNPLEPNNGLNEALNTQTSKSTVNINANNSVTESSQYLKENEYGELIFDWELFFFDWFQDWEIDYNALWTYFGVFNN